MAKVRLSRREVERGHLPPVCALTGVPTDDVKRKTFSWMPSWVGLLILFGLLPYLIIALIMRKSMTVDLPLVREKHGHWLWRTVFLLIGVSMCVSLLVGGGIMSSGAGRGSSQESVAGVLFALGIVGFLAVLIAALVLSQKAIRPTEITDNEITLAGVHPRFRDAIEYDREEEYERDRAARRGRGDRLPRPTREDEGDDDEDRPRRFSRRYDD
jgi:hypothetical protein